MLRDAESPNPAGQHLHERDGADQTMQHAAPPGQQQRAECVQRPGRAQLQQEAAVRAGEPLPRARAGQADQESRPRDCRWT